MMDKHVHIGNCYRFGVSWNILAEEVPDTN